MDVKGLVRSVIPFATQITRSVRKDAKTESSTDREGNGQSAQEDTRRRNLTPEEIQEAILYLESLPGVKENNLKVRLSTADGVNCVFIEDSLGKVVRRIPEADLSTVLANKSQKVGHLLNRAL